MLWPIIPRTSHNMVTDHWSASVPVNRRVGAAAGTLCSWVRISDITEIGIVWFHQSPERLCQSSNWHQGLMTYYVITDNFVRNGSHRKCLGPQVPNIKSRKKDQVVLRPGSEVEVATLKGKKSVIYFLLSTDQSSPSVSWEPLPGFRQFRHNGNWGGRGHT